MQGSSLRLFFTLLCMGILTTPKKCSKVRAHTIHYTNNKNLINIANGCITTMISHMCFIILVPISIKKLTIRVIIVLSLSFSICGFPQLVVSQTGWSNGL